ncbi:glycosyl transferase family 2 [Lelliottia aquatilis]|uniref:glycosyltransferase n=1 Tax=Lelliottia aquatilis TaxID=2080838 RepID=UPI000CDF2139|nr:glycosyltransferase family 2 protein [Lelliottia aquatilis]POZ19608.1 glycosyl transferase family 2 [Lelliottia aquatilis]
MIYLSICIPTKNRLEYLRSTIESIINDNVDKELYQIVISDNSDDDHTKDYADKLISNGYNVKYYKNPTSGFYNSIQALRLGDGNLLKLHNDYSAFKSGTFRKLLNYAVDNSEAKPLLFFTNGELKSSTGKCNFKTFNDFIVNASYLITWSSSFAIWKEDLHQLNSEPQDLDDMFPHTSLLLQVNKSEYIIVDDVLFENISVKKKGGYNIFYNFCILFLDMLFSKVKDNEITIHTFRKVKRDMYYRFITVWYYRTITNNEGNYTFDNVDANENIKKAYGSIGLLGVICISKIKYLVVNFCKIISK